MNLVKIFKDLVSIDSPSGFETEVSDYIFKFLTNLGYKPYRDKHDMIYLRIGDKPNPRLITAHMDTVEPGRQIIPIEKDGMILSQGETILGADNKAPLSVILYTIQELTKEGVELNLEILFTVREETDSGIRDFESSVLQAKVAYLFDGGEGLDTVYIDSAFIADFKVEIFGRGAHISEPHLGVNAFEVLYDIHDKVKIGQVDDFSTLNFGIIRSGTTTNSIPSHLILEGDLRSFRKDKFDLLRQNLENALEESSTKLKAGLKITWIPYCEGYSHDQDDPVYLKALVVYKKLGLNLRPLKDTGGSDAGFLNSIGIKACCFGDGVIDSHSTDERISVANLIKLQEICRELMVS